MTIQNTYLTEALDIIAVAHESYPYSRDLALNHAELLAGCGKDAQALDACQAFTLCFGLDEKIMPLGLKLRGLVGIYNRLAETARQSLSLCMIVKNEEKNLAACLASLKPVVHEMIIVDTGSTDQTIDIATVFGAQVYGFKWNGNFSDARNFAIEQAHGAWILVMDADELLSKRDYAAVMESITTANGRKVAWSVVSRNYTAKVNAQGWTANDGAYPAEEAADGWHPSWKVRLFPNQPDLRFDGEVHEMVENSLMTVGYAINRASFVVHHYGGLEESAEEVAEKRRRYFEIGIKKLEKNPNDKAALTELAVQAGEMGNFEEAIRLWDRLLKIVPNTVEALFNKGYALIGLQKYQEALAVSEKVLELAPAHKEAAFNYGTCMLYVGNPAKSLKKLEPILQQHPEYPPLLAVLTLLYLISGHRDKAASIYSKLTILNYAITDYAKARAEVLIRLDKEDLARKLLGEYEEIGMLQFQENDK